MARLFSAYTDVPDFLANATALIETASLIGGSTTLAVAASAGALTLTVANTNDPIYPFPQTGSFRAYILDGPRSERVTATATGSTQLSIAGGTLAAHASGVSISTAGVAGCLADIILQASSTAEMVCMQGPAGGDRGLWQVSRSEILRGPGSMRAEIDRDRTLLLRPFHFPVVSVSAVTLAIGGQPASALTTTYLTLPDDARLIEIPSPLIATADVPGGMYLGRQLPRSLDFYITLSYVGGPVAGSTLDDVPYDIKEAVFLIIQDRLALGRQNPMGVLNSRRGDTQWAYGGKSTTKAESMLLMQARELLAPYTAPAGW